MDEYTEHKIRNRFVHACCSWPLRLGIVMNRMYPVCMTRAVLHRVGACEEHYIVQCRPRVDDDGGSQEP